MIRATSLFLCSLFALVSPCTLSAEIVVDFEDLTTFTANNPSGSGQYYNGNSGSGTNSDGWTSGGMHFNNTYTDAGSFDFWSGWAYSNVEDASTPGFLNQYASAAGGGSDGQGGVDAGGNYAVGYSNTYFNVPSGYSLASVDLTNTTYGALSMRDGDGFAKQFGGQSGDEPDFFQLILTGYDALDGASGSGNVLDSIVVDLADYRFSDNTQDYILNDWLSVDLSSIQASQSVGISFASSDSGSFGINTPTYVALDNLTLSTTPEPSSLAMLVAAGLSVGWTMRRRHLKAKTTTA